MTSEPDDWDLPSEAEEDVSAFEAPSRRTEPPRPSVQPPLPASASDLQDLFSDKPRTARPGTAEPPASSPADLAGLFDDAPRRGAAGPAPEDPALRGSEAPDAPGENPTRHAAALPPDFDPFHERPRSLRTTAPPPELIGTDQTGAAPDPDLELTSPNSMPVPAAGEATTAPGSAAKGRDAGEQNDKRGEKPKAKEKPATRPTAPPNPFGEMLLSDLQSRLAASTPKDPVASAMNRTAARLDRKIAAKSAPFVAESRHAQSELKELSDIPLEVQFIEGRDPREDERWYLDLPPEEQERLRRKWQLELRLGVAKPQSKLHARVNVILQGMAAFSIAALPIAAFMGWWMILRMLVAGVFAGIAFSLIDRTRFSCAIIGAVIYFVSNWDAAFGDPTTVLIGAVLVANLCALVGMNREMRLSGGFGQE
jgi:hypothetical protein